MDFEMLYVFLVYSLNSLFLNQIMILFSFYLKNGNFKKLAAFKNSTASKGSWTNCALNLI
jgi:hypothetical protein